MKYRRRHPVRALALRPGALALRPALKQGLKLALGLTFAAAVSGSGCAPHELAAGARGGGEVDPASVGMDPDSLARLDRVLDSALTAGAAPGAALAIGRHGRLVRLRGYGVLDRADTVPVTPTTLFDLASLTKVVGTTSAIMLLVDEGSVELDAPVVTYLPWWAGPHPAKAGITVRQLLSHQAGLAPFRRWYLEMEGEEAYRAALAAEAPETAPGGPPVYSDLGVMTLGFLVEAVAGEPLDAFLDRRVFRPLSMEDTGFRPDPALAPRIAPTEVDTVYRHRHLRGEVHDENAWALGGVAGHAGLFSSASDLAVFAQLLLDRGVALPCRSAEAGATCPEDRGQELALLDPATVRLFTTPVSDGTTRALGWDTPGGRSSAGDYFTPSAFGHTGYTGTSIWIDPELDLFVVLLTNRVNPTRANTRHVPLRRRVHDLAARAITDRPVRRRP
jgi:CubicO group peptidase (beta-lactamase class C family)